MENKIQFDQECAIIPLKQFNEMKANEAVFFQKVTNKENFYGFEETDRWDPRTRRAWFVPVDWYVKRQLERKYGEDFKHERKRAEEQSIEIHSLKEENKNLHEKLNRLYKKRWYQFIPFNENF